MSRKGISITRSLRQHTLIGELNTTVNFQRIVAKYFKFDMARIIAFEKKVEK